MRSKFDLPIHPILFCLYPIIYLYAQNLVYIEFTQTLRSFAISLALGGVFWLLFGLLLRNWQRSSTLASLIVILFFSFGHAGNAFEKVFAPFGLGLATGWLAAAWLVVFLVLSYLILQVNKLDQITQILNTVGIALLIFPVISILQSGLVNAQTTKADLNSLEIRRGQKSAEANLELPSHSQLPDIYYIVFDGYVRHDVLSEYYNFNNAEFLNDLERRGFYIVSDSRSNYMNTNYSLNTSLNLLYVHEFPRSVFLASKYNLRTNYLSDFLRQVGYQIVVFDSGSNDTTAQYADIFISPDRLETEMEGGINSFEFLLLRSTLGVLLLENQSRHGNTGQANDVFTASVNRELDRRRERIEYAFANLPDFAADQPPQFLFAHIYLPHIPFLYGPEGEPLRYHEELNLYWYEVPPEDYPQVYSDQVEALNAMALEMIDKVLRKASRPVVIVLQSDHGDEFFLDYEQPDELGVHVRSAILNTIYFSDREYSQLYPTLTPVNTFRVVLNHWFGTTYPDLPDKVFFHEHPLSTARNEIPEFIDACSEFNICIP